MFDCDYETADQRYPYCFRVRGTIKTYISARDYAAGNFSPGSWTSTWTMESRDYSDDQLRDWLFLFKLRDNYMLFMLAWHDVHI